MDTKNNNLLEEEINLMELLLRIKASFLSNYRLVIYILLVSATTGLILFLRLPKRYDLRMMADSRVLASKEVVEIINSLNSHLKKQDFNLLSQKLKLSTKSIEDIYYLEAVPTSETVDGISNSKDAFVITSAVKNKDIIDSLQYTLVNYIETFPFVRKRIEIEKQNLQLMLDEAIREKKQLDTLQLRVMDLLKKSGNTTIILDPSHLNEQKYEFEEKIIDLKYSIKFVDNIQIITQFDHTNKPDSPSLFLCLIVSIAFGVLASIILIFTRLKPIQP
jgi:hypothetical protein